MKEFNKVIGYENIKIELIRIVDMMRNPEKYSKLGVTTTRGLLLSGVPGVGKTLMAQCFIKASRRKAYTIRKDMPGVDFIKTIKQTFDEAKKLAPSIVFLDDIDKFANNDGIHKNAEEYITIQSCIDDVKDYEVFVLATANNIRQLPSSLLRAGRFDKEISVGTPKGIDAEKIVKHYLKKKAVVDSVDYKEIARLLDGRSCASLETVINEAGVYSAFEGKDKIDMPDIIRAFMRIVYDSPEDLSLSESKYTRNLAVHEAGHVLVSELLEPGSVTLATIMKHDGGGTGGFVSYQNDVDYFESKQFMENRVKACLAGKAATEIVFGITDVGANTDIKRAFDIVKRFVGSYCEYGFGYWENLPDNNEIESPVLINRKVQLIQNEMERYYQQTKKIIIDNREFLDRLTESLTEKKVLISKDIQNIKTECSIVGTLCYGD